MTTIVIMGCLLGTLGMMFGIIYHMLKRELKNKMNERTITVEEEE